MSDDKKNETKEKILEVARQLFSKSSFNSVSVRDIAKASNVNVASINYHFQSKENLFWNVVKECSVAGEAGIQQISEQAESIEDFVSMSLDFLMQDLATIRTNIRIKLTDEVKEPTGDMKSYFDKRPPILGLEYIIQFLNKEFNGKASEEALQFAAESIIGSIMQTAIFALAVRPNKNKNDKFDIKSKHTRKKLLLQTRAICDYVRSHPNL